MPMTPWHVGPGLAFKAVAGPRMSLAAFVVAQGLMDLEVVARILTRQEWVHGPTHTLVGAVVVAAAAAAVTTPVARGFWWVWRRNSEKGGAAWAATRWSAAGCGALIGTISHVVLDAVMHHDAYPFWPFASWNPLLGLVGIGTLHDLCFWSGAAGVVALAVLQARRVVQPGDPRVE